jgi:hypothetical protein
MVREVEARSARSVECLIDRGCLPRLCRRKPLGTTGSGSEPTGPILEASTAGGAQPGVGGAETRPIGSGRESNGWKSRRSRSKSRHGRREITGPLTKRVPLARWENHPARKTRWEDQPARNLDEPTPDAGSSESDSLKSDPLRSHAGPLPARRTTANVHRSGRGGARRATWAPPRWRCSSGRAVRSRSTDRPREPSPRRGRDRSP